MSKFRSVAVLAGVALLGSACGPEAEQAAPTQVLPSWEEFRASAQQDPEGAFIVDGDIALGTEAELREFYDGFAQGDLGTSTGGLAVYRTGSTDIKWNTTQAANITYCISQSSFGSRYNAVVTAMTNAAAAWEATARVNFVHSSGQDGNCTASNANVVFDVRQVSGAGYTARAFFPNSSRSSRNVLIDSSAFGNLGVWTLTGVLRHELGHTLGFRHEHTRLSSTGCYEDANWRGLTNYDSSSVMHYPQCKGTQTGDLVLTSSDKTGARALYP
ncbi:M57 family metalloprotease [Stigmatella aurantiaca]|nr:M57 family metalloprotease [Stigmatella aurantiaca]ADO75363.1 Peptidase [Stigmatella aurantiaca DW4/3-1]